MLIRKSRGPIEFIVPDELDEHGKPIENATVFVLRPDNRATQDLMAKHASEDGMIDGWTAAKLAILDVKGGDPESDPIEFDPDGFPTDDWIEGIPRKWRMQIATEFLTAGQLSKAERKNSE